MAGLGCRPGCDVGAVLALLARAAALAPAPGCLAAPAFRASEPALREAAARLGLPLLWVEDAALRAEQPRCPTRSAAAERARGLASVAEAAALAAAGPGSTLLLPRIAAQGVTLALAREGKGAIPSRKEPESRPALGPPPPPGSEPRGQKSFGSSFQKRTCFLPVSRST